MHVARFGRLVERMVSEEHGFLYENLVNEVRKRIPSAVEFIVGRVEEISTRDDRQRVELATAA